MKIIELFETNKQPKDTTDWDETDWAEWDNMMDRLEKKAKSGEQEVYYNPKTRQYGVRAKKKVDEYASAGGTSTGSIASIPSPHLSPGKARGKKSWIGDPWGGKSGTKSPPQPKPKKQKPTDNALDMKGVSIFGGPLKR